MNRREDDSRRQPFHTQALQGIEEGVQSRLAVVDHAVVLVRQA